MWRVGEFRKAAIKYDLLFKAAVTSALRHAGETAVQEARTTREFKRRSATGSVKDNTTWKFLRRGRNPTIRLKNTKQHAIYLEHGTRPHRITARRKKYLRFVVGGKVFLRKTVFHPGTRATKFFSHAAWEGTKALRADLIRRLSSLGRRRL